MAYDASQTDRPQAQTLGSTPLSERQPPQGTETPPDGSQTGSTTPSSSPEQNPNKAPQRASSGMFTNIQNYISKNQPQGAKMADAASKSMEQTAQAVQGKADQVNKNFQAAATASAPKNLDTAVNTVSNVANVAAGKYEDVDRDNFQTPDVVGNNYDPIKFDTSRDDEIYDILNMQYKGPTDLRSIQGYGDASNEAAKAQQLMNTVRSGDRGQLLKQTFGQNQDYTSGQRNLDDLVLGKNIAQVQDTVQQLGPMSGVLDQAQQQASAFAQERADEILGVRDQSRGALQQIAELRAAEVDKRLSQTVKNWNEMPEYMRGILRSQTGGATLTDQEMALLGLNTDQNLYNSLNTNNLNVYNPKTGATVVNRDNNKINEFIQSSGTADRQALTEKREFDQLSRLQALTNLAQGGLGFDDYLTKNNINISDRSLVGQKTLEDAINKENIQNIINKEKKLYDTSKRQKAIQTDINKMKMKNPDNMKSRARRRHNDEIARLERNLDSMGKSNQVNQLKLGDDAYNDRVDELNKLLSGENVTKRST